MGVGENTQIDNVPISIKIRACVYAPKFKTSNNPHVSGPLLQEWRVGGILEFVVLSARNAVEEGLDDPIFRNVVRTLVDHQGWDLNLRESVNYGPRRERVGPAGFQFQF